ncbi:MAG: DUF433 domain-containing protein [Bacteroidales bacterium]
MFDFEKLEVYKKAKIFNAGIRQFPKEAKLVSLRKLNVMQTIRLRVNDKVLVGKPVIKDTRLSVEHVISLKYERKITGSYFCSVSF